MPVLHGADAGDARARHERAAGARSARRRSSSTATRTRCSPSPTARHIARLIPGARLEILERLRPHLLVGAPEERPQLVREHVGARASPRIAARASVERGGEPAPRPRARAGARRRAGPGTTITSRRRSSWWSAASRRIASISASTAGLVVAGVERAQRLARRRRRSARSSRIRAARPSAWKLPATSASTLERLVLVAAAVQQRRRAAPRRRRAPGSSSSAWRSDASSPACDELVGLGRHERVEEALDRGRRLRADELVDDLAVPERLDGRDALDPEALRDARGWRRCRPWRARPCPRARPRPSRAPASSARHGAAPLGPEVDDHRQLARSARSPAAWKSASVTSMTVMRSQGRPALGSASRRRVRGVGCAL